jgi:hypothetical protein
MTLLDAKHFDEAAARRRKIRIATVVVTVLVLGWVGWMFRNWPQEHLVDKFFTALQNKDYETAYGLWTNDADWKQHPEKHGDYPYNDFYRDWGPGGEWGLIRSHSVYGSVSPKGSSTGVVVDVVVNERAEHARVWVQKSDKTLSFSPY